MRAVVFAGPSLSPQARPAMADVEWRPPVRQGDVYRAALSRPAIIAIIDGYFEVTPTVWHKEILWAMTQGIHVYGAASIGALRAAELDAFGMKGVGRIYEMYRDGVLEDDDEVAVQHGPEELGYPALTEAMVNVRATVAQAVACGCLDAEAGILLQSLAKGLFFKRRTYDALLAAAKTRGLPDPLLRRFAEWIRHGAVDQKRTDASALLDAVREHLDGSYLPLQPCYEFADTHLFRAAVAADEDGR